MKAVLCKSLDGIAGLSVEDIEAPHASPGEVVVAVQAVALNFFDTLIVAGRYQTKPSLPFSPGGEIAGLVVEVGAGVTDWAVGMACVAYIGFGGARERVAVRAERLVRLPEGVSPTVGCAVPITYGTAVHGLRDRGQLAKGETVAILGAGGGAGLAAIEIAKRLGARVIAVASSKEKLQACLDRGADETVSSTDADIKTALRALTRGEGVDIVYDCVGGDLAEPAFRTLRWKGRYLVVGFASGDVPRLPLNLFLLKGASALGVFWGEAVEREPARYREDVSFVLDGVKTGAIVPHIGCELPLDEIKTGLERIGRRELVGKAVLNLSPLVG